MHKVEAITSGTDSIKSFPRAGNLSVATVFEENDPLPLRDKASINIV